MDCQILDVERKGLCFLGKWGLIKKLRTINAVVCRRNLVQIERIVSGHHREFDWIGFAVLLVGLNVSIWSLGHDGCSSVICFLVMLVFIRRLDWKNVFTALVVTITLFHPIRFIYDWSQNPIMYNVIAAVCILLLIVFIHQYGWKHFAILLFLACSLLSSHQAMVSASEVGSCYVEDRRYNEYFYCMKNKRGYQQIQSLPIGMRGWCYYCAWY